MDKFEESADVVVLRAGQFAPPLYTSRMTGDAFDGYWIDDQKYFFCAFESDLRGQVVLRPKIADALSNEVVQVIEPKSLVALLEAATSATLDESSIASARYEMPDADTLAVSCGVGTFLVDVGSTPKVRATVTGKTSAYLYSPNGKYGCYLKGQAVWVEDQSSGAEWQLSPTGQRYNSYGYLAESGLAPITSRNSVAPVGLWSPDSQWFATQRVDERYLPEASLHESESFVNGAPLRHTFKISPPNHPLAKLTFAVFDIWTGRTIELVDWPVLSRSFSPFALRECWFAGNTFYFLSWDRYYTNVSLMAVSLKDGAVREVISESCANGWIDLNPFAMGQPLVRVLAQSNLLIWWSQSDGYGHLYLYDLQSGVLRNQITKGNWVVRDIVHIDEQRRRILFTASGFTTNADPMERCLGSVKFDGTELEAVFTAFGEDIACKADPVCCSYQMRRFRKSYARSGVSLDGKYFVATSGAADRPTRTILADIEQQRCITLGTSSILETWSGPLPQLFDVFAADGRTKLHGALYFPSNFDNRRTYPIVDYIYPGPQLNWHARRFPSRAGLTLRSIAELGVVGIILETRGMPGRSRAFHQAGYGNLLEPQLSDHAAAISQLCNRCSYLDARRAGILGHSGGGYASARALFDYPSIFSVGVAVCGNHDNRNYASPWIDKYGPRPSSSERDKQANQMHVQKLKGKLLLIHGEMDENVHPSHTVALGRALRAAGKEFDEMIVPGANHGVLFESAVAYQRMLEFFGQHLVGLKPCTPALLSWSHEQYAASQYLMTTDFS